MRGDWVVGAIGVNNRHNMRRLASCGRSVAGRIDGEVQNLKLSASLSPEEIEHVNAALVKHKLLFFRG